MSNDVPMLSMLMLDFGAVRVPASVEAAVSRLHPKASLIDEYARRQQRLQEEDYKQGKDMKAFQAEEWGDFMHAITKRRPSQPRHPRAA